jgi:GNAT superfamily N-acetyltransferase
MPIANLPLESAAYHSLNKPYEAAHLRWAEFKDIAKLVELYNRARAEAVEDTESMEDWLEHGGALILEDARGDMLCALRYREEGSGWRVDRIATHPNARSQGYGRWLMTKVEALAIRTNIPTLTLTLDEVRDDLVQYYQRMGYRVREQSADELTLEKRVGGMWQYKR